MHTLFVFGGEGTRSDRSRKAVELLRSSNYTISDVVLTGGNPTENKSEARRMNDFIRDAGLTLPTYLDENSRDSLGNLYHGLEQYDATIPRNFLAITDDFHLPRVRSVVEHILPSTWTMSFVPSGYLGTSREKVSEKLITLLQMHDLRRHVLQGNWYGFQKYMQTQHPSSGSVSSPYALAWKLFRS